MGFKRLILTSTFLLFFASLLCAQRSASATMRVSVRVVEGASVQVSDEAAPEWNLDQSKGGFKLADVKISHSEGNRVSIVKPTTLNLINERGERVSLKLTEIDGKTATNGLSYQLGLDEKSQQIKKGKYKGSLTTSITYI